MPFCKLEPLMRAALLSFCLVLVGSSGCKVKNPNYCADNVDHLCEQPDGGGMACETSDDCPMAEPVCRPSDHVCVQCADGATEACGGNNPVCNLTTNRCEACDTHADCPSNACLPTGACANADDVLYVDGMSPNTMTCDKANPCSTVQAALAASATKSIIRVTGKVATGTVITLNSRDVTILGEIVAPTAAKTSILSSTGATDVMALDGTSKVRLYDLQLDGALGVDRNAIVIANTHSGELELQRCVVTNNYFGITNGGNSLVTLSRSIVSTNNHGGVILNGNTPKFDITNNFIFRNGGSGGGIQHSGITIIGVNPGTPARLEFNTIVDNDANGGGSRSGGVQCTMTSFAAPNNLIVRNALDDDPNMAGAQVNGGCVFTGSVTSATLMNITFVKPDSGPFDYHLVAPSLGAIDQATGGAPLMIDFDGQKRPNGMVRDIGADEFYMP